MSVFDRFLKKEEPVTCDVKESETLSKAKEIVKRGEDLAQKINEAEHTIELLLYALNEGKDNVSLQITRAETAYTWTGSSAGSSLWPVEHKLWMDITIQETLLRSMLTYYRNLCNEYKEEYKKL